MAAWWTSDYPHRYYVSVGTPSATSGVAPITGCYDMGIFSQQPADLPTASDLVALSAADFAASPFGKGILNGKLVDYTPPAVVVPLKAQAVTAQAWIQQQANLAAAMGEVFTTDMKTYVKAIAAIANGTDTTSTALPTRPTDVMETGASNAMVSGTSITDTGTSSTTTAATSSAVTAT